MLEYSLVIWKVTIFSRGGVQGIAIKILSAFLAVYGPINWAILAIYGPRNKVGPFWQFMAPEIVNSWQFMVPETAPFW